MLTDSSEMFLHHFLNKGCLKRNPDPQMLELNVESGCSK